MNLLLLVRSDAPENTDLAEALRSLVARAERADAALFARHGYAAPRDFFAGFRRVSAVLLRRTGAPGSAEAVALPPIALWPNPQARQPLPADLRALLARSRRVQRIAHSPAHSSPLAGPCPFVRC